MTLLAGVPTPPAGVDRAPELPADAPICGPIEDSPVVATPPSLKVAAVNTLRNVEPLVVNMYGTLVPFVEIQP